LKTRVRDRNGIRVEEQKVRLGKTIGRMIEGVGNEGKREG
jgi:hypothetical protein